MSSETPVRVLLIDDSEESYAAICKMADAVAGARYDIQWIDNYIRGIKTLTSEEFDLGIVKYELPNNGGIEFLKYANLHDQNFPALLLLNSYDEQAVAEAMNAGACDYLTREELSPFIFRRVIQYSMTIKENQRQLVELSYRDPLTGISNRSLFQIRLRDAIALSKRQETMVAVLFLDVDNFKDINELMGYPAGDQMLVEMARRLQTATRESDIISRMGGDEFSVVATNIQSENDVVRVANRLLDSLVEPISVDNFDFKVNVSIGIALYPTDGTTAEMMIRNGDEALFQAKSVSRGAYHFFNREMQERRKSTQQFEKELQHSLIHNELFLLYQPVVDLKSGNVIGAEALVRWNHPVRGVVSPEEFIPIAERSDFIIELGHWVLREACRQCAEWKKTWSRNFVMAVNVSLAQIRKGDFVEVVHDVIMETGIAYRDLTLEITESMIADNSLTVLDTLYTLRELGVSISVDDFGAGHSSLARLKNFPVNDLKIDRSLISNVSEDQQDAAIAIAILTLARELNLDAIAEGIETVQQADFMRENGCAFAQGYYFSRPVRARDFEKQFLSDQSMTG